MAALRSITLLLFLLSLPALAQSPEFGGIVLDSSGSVITNAVVSDESGHTTRTDAAGHFHLATPSRELDVRAPGFTEERIPLAGTSATNITVHLSIARPEELVSVSDSNGVLAPDTTTFSATALRQAPTFTLDEALRDSPGFSLLRRTPSWTANPTTQGVSLQGTGSTSSSRALVLQDGIPLNDPFGSWIYWQRIPVTEPERVELQTGGGSGLYGSDAIGGAINIVSRRPLDSANKSTHASTDFSYGNLHSPSGSASLTTAQGKWAGSASFFGASTSGCIPVPLVLRGAADSYSDSTNKGITLRLDRKLGTSANAFLVGSLYGESRDNGTHLQTNGATLRELRTGADLSSVRLGSFSARLYGGTETLRQTYSSVSTNRNTETLTDLQGIPVSQIGASVLWTRPFVARQLLLAGFDLRSIEGESDDLAYTAGAASSFKRAGGLQMRYGGFVEDRLRLSQRVLLTLSARLDHWSNHDAHSTTQSLSTASLTRTTLPSHSALAFDPRLALSYAPNSRWTFTGSAARAFRAPTLNELYRAFRVGNVLTLSNPTLRDERSTNVQSSALYSPNSVVTLRATGFWNGINDPDASVTLSTTPTLITRQRENLGSQRAAGLEASAGIHFRRLQLDAAYQYAHSTVTSFAANPILVGNWIPQVARHSASLRAIYVRHPWTLILDTRYFGRQFDDDLNQYPLTGAFVASAALTRSLPRGFQAYIAADNLLDRRYDIARTPTLSTAPPTLARAGFRWQSREP